MSLHVTWHNTIAVYGLTGNTVSAGYYSSMRAQSRLRDKRLLMNRTRSELTKVQLPCYSRADVLVATLQVDCRTWHINVFV